MAGHQTPRPRKQPPPKPLRLPNQPGSSTTARPNRQKKIAHRSPPPRMTDRKNFPLVPKLPLGTHLSAATPSPSPSVILSEGERKSPSLPNAQPSRSRRTHPRFSTSPRRERSHQNGRAPNAAAAKTTASQAPTSPQPARFFDYGSTKSPKKDSSPLASAQNDGPKKLSPRSRTPFGNAVVSGNSVASPSVILPM